MHRTTLAAFAVIGAALAAAPASAAALTVKVDSFGNGKMMPSKYAFCAPAAQGHTKPGGNINPRISWSKGPKGTKSYAIILYDTDSPAEQREKMNKEGEVLTKAVPRKDFYHWVLVDIPANVTSVAQGEDSNARVLHGKPATPSKLGMKGLNDYTKATAANPAMKGEYFGYDGPCPPWNDEDVHHYHFTVYALSVAKLDLPQEFDGPAVLAAMKGKVLAKGEVTDLYTQNPKEGAKVEK